MTAIGARYTGDFGTLEVMVDQVDVSSAIDGLGYIHRETPGRTSYWLNDEQISQDEAQRIVDEWHRRRTPTV